MNQPLQSLYRLCLNILLITMISGCATSSPTRGPEMVPADLQVIHRHPYSVQIRVTGGQATELGGQSQISNEAFTEALTRAITDTRVFARVTQGAGADYLLEIRLGPLDQPTRGLAMTVRMQANWRLSQTDSERTVWQQRIDSTFTASAISSRKAVTRVRLATEGAARRNIQFGLSALSQLDLMR